jgi:hypothetical protein
MDHHAGVHEPAGGPPAEGSRRSHPKDVLGYYPGDAQEADPRTPIWPLLPRAGRGIEARQSVRNPATTDEGPQCLVTVVSDEDTIRNLDTYKGYLARLADPRGLSPSRRRIIGKAKPIYMFTGGCTAPKPDRRKC